jgi:hypothetical protein
MHVIRLMNVRVLLRNLIAPWVRDTIYEHDHVYNQLSYIFKRRLSVVQILTLEIVLGDAFPFNISDSYIIYFSGTNTKDGHGSNNFSNYILM